MESGITLLCLAFRNEFRRLSFYEPYEKKPMIITSNREISEWAMIFNNSLIGSAAVDRLVHRGMEILLEGKSYRLDQFQKRTKEKTKKQ